MLSQWWQRYGDENVLPEFSLENRTAMQLDPVHAHWSVRYSRLQARLWWLEWYARPDLRESLSYCAITIYKDDILPEFWAQCRDISQPMLGEIAREVPVPLEILPALARVMSDEVLGYQASHSDEAARLCVEIEREGDIATFERLHGYCRGPRRSPLYEQWLQDNVDWELLLQLRFVVHSMIHPPEWVLDMLERQPLVQALITRTYRAASASERKRFIEEAAYRQWDLADSVSQYPTETEREEVHRDESTMVVFVGCRGVVAVESIGSGGSATRPAERLADSVESDTLAHGVAT